MIGFIIFSMALLIIVMWLIAPALLGQQQQTIDSAKQTNISITREKLADLDTQLSLGDITQEQYSKARDEIEFALLDDTETTDNSSRELPANYKRNIFVLLTTIPFVAFGLYQYWGQPDAITGSAPTASTQGANPHANQTSSGQTPPAQTAQGQKPQHAGSMEEALAKLEAKLKQNPNNPNGWYILARTYMVQKQYVKAATAFRTLNSMVANQPEILLGLADALTMSRNGDMKGEPFELAKQALKLQPNNTTALWLTGLGYQDNGDLKSAVAMWKKLLPLLTEDPQSAHEVKALIEQANSQLGITETITLPTASPAPAATKTQTAPMSAASITVQVKIDPALRSKVADTDYVMIYAQRVAGMKMPLAMLQAQVKDLPITVVLDDAMALMPTNKLSDEQQVNVIARISKSSQAMKQPGDIETKLGPYPVTGSAPVSITISQ